MSRSDMISQAFQTHFSTQPSVVCYAPGRVNLIGEHTDYNDGFVFPAAINFGTDVAAKKRQDDVVNVIALDFDNEKVSFQLSDIQPDKVSPWSNYVRGVLLCLQSLYPDLTGADLVVSGNVPQGAGLSSSASFEIALLKCFAQLNELSLSGADAAKLGQRAENEFVGCNCGIMDQMISAMGKLGHAVLLDCRSLEVQYSVLPANYTLMIVNSNVKRGLVDSEYNTRRQQCELAASIMNVKALRDADLTMLKAHQAKMDSAVYARAKHVISENQRTLDMFAALKQEDMSRVSELMRASHQSMRDDFEITVEPIDLLVQMIDQVLGEKGGVRMTGGGFGGCVVALVPNLLIEPIQEVIETHYQRETGIKESVFLCTPEQGAFA